MSNANRTALSNCDCRQCNHAMTATCLTQNCDCCVNVHTAWGDGTGKYHL
jgi:hypothetical protein